MNKTPSNAQEPPAPFASPPVTPLVLRANKRMVTQSERDAVTERAPASLPSESSNFPLVSEPANGKETA